MKTAFKPLGIAVAVAAASAGYVNVATAQPAVANNALGDLALVPYYTVNGEWITGIHIVNTSDKTQVVKFRFRRATDSMDALDFNIVMSPFDVYAGTIRDDEDGNIFWSAGDTTCTVPATTDGRLTMPSIYRKDAETGYVEIIAMGEPDDEATSRIAYAAKHVDDVPRNCDAVRSNFFADGTSSVRGVIDNETTYQSAWNPDIPLATAGENDFIDSTNALKVSYFIRDNATGIEFGDNAVHITDFLEESAITNQQFGYFSGDLNGFDFPDLNGADPVFGADRMRYNMLRTPEALGVSSLINEWTANSANGAALDWVVTMPGQYVMFDLPQYVTNSLADDGGWFPTITSTGAINSNTTCPRNSIPDGASECDFRDIPVRASIIPYNREEFGGETPDGELVVSPAPPGEVSVLRLPKETNVVTFGGNSVLGVSDADVTANLRQPFGWLALNVTSVDDDIRVCNWDGGEDSFGGPYNAAEGAALTKTCAAGNITNTAVPMIGFAAWSRSVAANPDASYGRIVAHSFTTSS
ncbi:MAG: hypothetical protein AB8B57_17315 [Congregibacter sp.]